MNRSKIANLPQVLQDDIDYLKGKANESGAACWGDGEDARLVGFKRLVKDIYYYEQSRRCCYCSIELQPNNKTKDLEHVIDKSGRPDLMFELRNLAVSCTTCNGGKKKKRVLIEGCAEEGFPCDSKFYMHIHPHFDEWSDHLFFDEYLRVVPRKDSSKGESTYSICNFNRLNAMRLCDFFDGGRASAEKLIRSYFEVSTLRAKKQRLDLLRDIANKSNNAKAKLIVSLLEQG